MVQAPGDKVTGTEPPGDDKLLATSDVLLHLVRNWLMSACVALDDMCVKLHSFR